MSTFSPSLRAVSSVTAALVLMSLSGPALGAAGSGPADQAEESGPSKNEPTGGSSADTDDQAADGWSRSFVPSALPTTLTERKLLVVAAGDRLEEARRAAETLRGALREAEAPLVMDASSLGDVAGLDDQKIVDAASNLPVEGIVILRIFPGSDQPNAVVAAYDTSGDAIAGFSVDRGTPPASAGSNEIGRGPSQETVDAIDSATSGSSRDDEHLRYELSLSDTWQLKDLEENTTHTGIEIYRQLGRQDLVREYRVHRRTKTLLKVIGVGGTAVTGIVTSIGAVLAVPGDSCERDTLGDIQNCDGALGYSAWGGILAVGGGYLMAASIGTWIASGSYDVHPVSKSGLKSVVREQNEILEVSEADADQTAPRSGPSEPTAARTARFGWSVAPTADGWQAFLMVQW
jgi:hypothetical protein